jgi:Domain of unknown function (DUF4399)
MWRRRIVVHRVDQTFPHLRRYFACVTSEARWAYHKDASPLASGENMMSLTPRAVLFGAVAVTLLSSIVARAETPAPPGAAVYFINLKDRATVTSPLKVQFGLTAMGIAPAGVEKEKTGHHHLLIDSKLSDEEAKTPLPMDAQHMHFGGGQTETTLTLPPGEHTLQLVLGDWTHIPFAPPIVSPVITVRVKQQGASAQRPSSPAIAGTQHH